jgi:putative DNA primase/helicase
MTRDKPSIGQQAKGRWQAILPALGIDKRYLVNRHGPCPMCDGKDRFRFDDKDGRGTWFCNQCGAGDGVDLVMRANNLDFKRAAREIEKHVGTAPVIAIRQGRPPEKVKAQMTEIWRSSTPMVGAAARWWMNRVGRVPDSPDLREVYELPLFDEGRNAGVFPAMVARVRDHEGRWVNLHRTYLDRFGNKAPVGDCRRVMDLQLPPGAAVRLAPVGVCLGIAEGIETAEAASIIHNVPVWAALTAQNLERWRPPAGVGMVRIFGDNDKSATGQAASWALAKRLRREGYVVTVDLPETEGDDWNDVLLARMGSEVAA